MLRYSWQETIVDIEMVGARSVQTVRTSEYSFSRGNFSVPYDNISNVQLTCQN